MTDSVSERGGEDRGDLGVLAVEQPGGRAALPGLEADQPVAAGGRAERDVDRAAGARASARCRTACAPG